MPEKLKFYKTCFIAAIVLYLLVFFYLFNIHPDYIGFDYSFFIPRLLEGLKFIRLQGWFPVPWYSITFCGALPFYGDPQNVFYSLPQVLTLFFEPASAVQISILVYLLLGVLGTYLLLSKTLKTNFVCSALAALLFMSNGYFRSRMLIGHFTFISYSLIPIILYFLCTKETKAGRSIFLAALLLASMIYTGAHYMSYRKSYTANNIKYLTFSTALTWTLTCV